MSLTHLRTFIAVHRRGSISEAARLLGLTQPAVSAHIAALEAQLGRGLFVRHARGVYPTAVADDLAANLGQTLDRAEAALAVAKARSAQLSGTIHLAGPAEFLGERIASVLPLLTQAGLEVRMRTGNKDSLYKMLLSDAVDLAFTASTPDDPRLDSQQIGTEFLMAVTHPTKAAAGINAPFLAYDLDLPLVRNWLQANGFSLAERAPAVTVPDLRVLKALVLSGTGWTILPDYLCSNDVETGKLIEITTAKARPSNGFHLVWPKGALRHPRVSFTKDLLLDALRSPSS